VVTPEGVVVVIPAVAVAADRATPAMEDTNTNPDMCSPDETISVLNHVGFYQVFRIGRRKPDLSRRQNLLVRLISLIDVLSENRCRSKRPALIKR